MRDIGSNIPANISTLSLLTRWRNIMQKINVHLQTSFSHKSFILYMINMNENDPECQYIVSMLILWIINIHWHLSFSTMCLSQTNKQNIRDIHVHADYKKWLTIQRYSSHARVWHLWSCQYDIPASLFHECLKHYLKHPLIEHACLACWWLING